MQLPESYVCECLEQVSQIAWQASMSLKKVQSKDISYWEGLD